MFSRSAVRTGVGKAAPIILREQESARSGARAASAAYQAASPTISIE